MNNSKNFNEQGSFLVLSNRGYTSFNHLERYIFQKFGNKGC